MFACRGKPLSRQLGRLKCGLSKRRVVYSSARDTHLVFEDDHEAERLLGDEVDDGLVVLEGDQGHIQALRLVFVLAGTGRWGGIDSGGDIRYCSETPAAGECASETAGGCES